MVSAADYSTHSSFLVLVQKRGMARIQRTHHPIFQGSLETSTFSPIDSAVECGADSIGHADVSRVSPSAEATAQVLCFSTMQTWGNMPASAFE